MPEHTADSPPTAPLVLVGALHVDELVWPLGALAARASSPVRRERRAGGVAANVARAARAGGARAVVLVAALGDDADAGWLRATLEADAVEVRARIVDACPSGRYTAVHDERGELYVGLADTGIAERLDAEAVRRQLAELDPAALVLDANLDPECLRALLEREPADTVPRAALAVSPTKACRLAPFLPTLDLLLCNRREAAALGSLDTDAPLDALGDALAHAGCARFVLTDGADAVLVHTPAGRTRLAVPPLDVNATVNGAGDALAGATIARWLDTGDLVAAVRDAGLPAAAAVLRGGEARSDAASAPSPRSPLPESAR